MRMCFSEESCLKYKTYAKLSQQLTTLSPGETLLLKAPCPRLQRSGPVQADTGPQRVPLLLPTAVPAGGCATALQTPAGITRETPGTPNKVHLQVTAVIVIPIWPTSSFYNVFWPDGQRTAPFVTTMIATQPFFICGPLVNGIRMQGRRQYKTAIMHVNFKRNAPNNPPDSSRCLQGGCEWCCP